MLTPQEVSERSFAKASFGGYNMSMVDDFLDVLTADYTALYNENAVLKSKMKVLVDKVEEYRSTEEAMRKALLTAQRIADEMVAEAESKKTAMLAQVEEDAARRMAELQREEADQAERLNAAKAATLDYVAALKRELAKEVDFLAGLEGISAPERKADPVQTAVRDIEQNLKEIVKEPAVDPDAETRVFAPVEVQEPQQAPAAKARFEPYPAAQRAEEPPAEEGDEELDTAFDFSTDAFFATPVEEQPERNETVGRVHEPEAREEQDDEPTTRRRIDFSNLQFGADYEIK